MAAIPNSDRDRPRCDAQNLLISGMKPLTLPLSFSRSIEDGTGRVISARSVSPSAGIEQRLVRHGRMSAAFGDHG